MNTLQSKTPARLAELFQTLFIAWWNRDRLDPDQVEEMKLFLRPEALALCEQASRGNKRQQRSPDQKRAVRRGRQ
jgi:hypothetical protein